ncbi:MAG: hypothetical protein WD512_09350 [Candidatus Paceibacterota bacterium]
MMRIQISKDNKVMADATLPDEKFSVEIFMQIVENCLEELKKEVEE